MDNLKTILNYLPYEVLLLHFLKKTNNEDIHDFILNSNNFSIFIGYIYKIINLYYENTFHFFRINNELFFNNNLYDYIISDNQIIPEFYNTVEHIYINDFFNIHSYIFNKTPDVIIIQEEDAEPIETNLFKNFIKNNESIFNINTYINNNKFFNFFNYYLDIVILKDSIYFIHNNKKFIFKDNSISPFEWNIDSTNKSILMSIYRLIN